jgi:RHH-type proline utilization regulon transcriptional repressor/proline dehydrogenase/delta 1-pyrroline-5-carboxylate dehydrogenase
MADQELNRRIVACGQVFFDKIRGTTPSLFDKAAWLGKVMDYCMRHDEFRVQMFRFVDVFPKLTDSAALTRHLQEYFAGEDQEIPDILKWGVKASRFGGSIGGALLGRTLRNNIRDMARQFIIGETIDATMTNLDRLRDQGFAAVIDLLGEATVSEEEADAYVADYLELLTALSEAQRNWPALGDTAPLDWGHAPRINLAIKPTALYSQVRPEDFEGSVAAIFQRMKKIYDRVIELDGHLCIDMESYRSKEITLEVFRRLRNSRPDYPHLGIVLQSYLQETDADLDRLLDWARSNRLPISIRLVKGAYWDYETLLASQNGWPDRVYRQKAETDAAFERQARQILENHVLCHLACGSHNIRTIAAVLETARELKVPEERYEFQVLYGMAEPIRQRLLETVGRVRLYAPYGELVPGMAYLVRRLLENTSNQSFLRQSFAEQTDIMQLLADPRDALDRPAADTQRTTARAETFHNAPAVDFTQAEERSAFVQALTDVGEQLGRSLPLFIDGKDVTTDEMLDSVNPAAPDEVVGRACQAGPRQVEAAIAAARSAFPAWRSTPVAQRTAILRKAAAIATERRFELAAWQVFEVGKQWGQAYADVAEAIDFLEYYAQQMQRLAVSRRMGRAPGEENRYRYEPLGVAVVIAPWNFPLAISCGMIAAALVTGNSVVYKPSSRSPVTGRLLMEIFHQAGLPPGVCNFVPGAGSEIGALLIEHPDVSLIAFTGSMETGRSIIEKAARVQDGELRVKRVIAEMGGKNAIIIDDDADFDEALPHVLYAAFGYQGQKCSACSRLIVLDSVYDRFTERLIKAVAALKIGPARDPANYLGPVIDARQQQKVLAYIDIGAEEGSVLYRSSIPDSGFYVPLTLIGDISPEHRLAQEEIFGPVLAIMRAQDFDQAISWANSTRFALTGGIFSRSPARLEQARREFRVGNLYLNRNCVGALVERQPFGGTALSGLGTKAGGPDYLLHFMEPRTITENTMRRGFAPTVEDDL